jgi:hypothetical protein
MDNTVKITKKSLYEGLGEEHGVRKIVVFSFTLVLNPALYW